MEIHQGRVGLKSIFTNEIDGQPYIVSTIPFRLRGVRVTGKELVGLDSDNDIIEGFDPGLEFDVVSQACVYKLPEKKKLFFINLTNSVMPIRDFHAVISNLLMRSHMQEMFGASCIEKYDKVGFVAVPAKLGFWRKRQYVFLVANTKDGN